MRNLSLVGMMLVAGCATSMTVEQFYTTFPDYSTSRYLTGAEAKAATQNGSCILIDDHIYNAPIGMTVNQDVANGAEGVDGIVANDGGNAYRISDFSWLEIGDGHGSTQLRIEFDTYQCDSP